MSVMSSVKGEDQDGFYGGQKKRPLSIIQENDGDEGDAGTTPVKGDIVNPAPEISAKQITIETKIASTATAKPVTKTNGVKKNDPKNKPQNIDTSRAKAQTCGTKPKSPNSKTPGSPDSKTSSKILYFSKSIRIAPKTDPNSKAPPPVAPKPKTPSPSPSKLKSPLFPSQTGDRHFAFHKSPTCSQSKTAVQSSKTPDTQTCEEEVARSMKNIVKRTVSQIENHVASMASTSKQKVKVDPPRRKISRDEAPSSKPSSREKENITAPPKSNCETEKSVPTSSSISSPSETQELTLTPASPTEAKKATDSSDSVPSSDKTETPTDTQTCTPSSKESAKATDSPDSTPTSNKTGNSTDTQMCTPSSKETGIVASTLSTTPPTDETENHTATQKSTPSSNETESLTAGQKSTPSYNETESLTAGQKSTPSYNKTESLTASQKSTPSYNETENLTATLKSTASSNETENLTANLKLTPSSNETENSTATQKSTPMSSETENSAATLTSTPPTNDAERRTPPGTSPTLSSETENTIAIIISTPNYETEKHTASSTSSSSSEAEKQTVTQTSQLPSGETETSSSNDTEYEDTLTYQGENSQLSTSESTTPEFTTPPTSPPLPQSKQISNVLFSPLLSSKTSHSSSELTRAIGSGPNSKSSQVLSDGQGLARIREAAESLKLTSSNPLVPKTSPSPPSRRVPFSFRQSPKLNHRPVSEAYSVSSLNNAKPMGSFNLNVLSLPSQFSTKGGDSGTSDSENEDRSQNKSGEKSRIAPRSPFLVPKFHPRRGSYFFKRRISSESLASLSENESTDNAEEPTPISASDFNKLKETADRLRLSTRRPSVLQWRQQYVESPGATNFPFRNGMNGDSFDERLTSERKQKIDEALDWLRNELHEMRSQDQMLARQLLTIRNGIHQLKLRHCTTEHQELLDDFKLEMEEQQEFSDVLDIPQPIYEDNPLKHIGVTRLNISARRFSAC